MNMRHLDHLGNPRDFRNSEANMGTKITYFFLLVTASQTLTQDVCSEDITAEQRHGLLGQPPPHSCLEIASGLLLGGRTG